MSVEKRALHISRTSNFGQLSCVIYKIINNFNWSKAIFLFFLCDGLLCYIYTKTVNEDNFIRLKTMFYIVTPTFGTDCLQNNIVRIITKYEANIVISTLEKTLVDLPSTV